MAEVICDSKSFTIQLEALAPALTIIDYTAPQKLKAGEEVQVSVTIRNDGGDCKYKIKLIDVSSGDIIDEEPNTYLVGDTIRQGETKTREVNSNYNPLWAMPTNDWALRVEAWRQI